MTTRTGRTFSVVLMCLFLAGRATAEDPPTRESVSGLVREVAERERQLTRAGRELADARARLALAEGKRDLAVTELRKVVTGYQDEVQ